MLTENLKGYRKKGKKYKRMRKIMLLISVKIVLLLEKQLLSRYQDLHVRFMN
jgi:transcriptional regulator of met regulon